MMDMEKTNKMGMMKGPKKASRGSKNMPGAATKHGPGTMPKGKGSGKMPKAKKAF
jgi:hypothetical protein